MLYFVFYVYLFCLQPISCIEPPFIAAHEFHVSKCVIDCKKSEEAIQVALHIFIDDLEEALRQQGADKLFICTEKESKKAEKYMIRYLQNHFKIIVNEEAVEYNFIGKEISDDIQAVWCYLEVENVNTINSLELRNDILMEVFDDQRNIINLKVDGTEEFLMFDKGNASKTFNYE